MSRNHLIWALALAAAACSSASPPAADVAQRPFPDIGGAGVMLLPVQRIVPAIAPPAAVDTTRAVMALSGESLATLEAELAYWLPEHARRVQWVLPEAIERAMRGSAALRINVRDLPVRDFQRSRLEFIGDPLYGELRRVAAVMDARLALLPLGALWIPEVGGTGRVHVAAALIDTMGGAVLWYGVAAGDTGAADDASAIASAAQALARQVPR
ncbi:MAG TPA: hypothetical protein VFZ24_06375 [Longimicrobiales bacterium]